MLAETLLYRQINPNFIDNGRISSQVFVITSAVFKPTPKDNDLLSVYNGEKFSPESAHAHFTELGLKSVGVAAITNLECVIENLEVINDNDPFEGHCSVDFSGKSSNQKDKIAKKLKNYSIARSKDSSGVFYG